MSTPELIVKYFNLASELPLSVYSIKDGKCLVSSGALDTAAYYISKPILVLPGVVHYRVTDEWMIVGYVKDSEKGIVYVLGPAFTAQMDRFQPQKYLRELGYHSDKSAQYLPYLEQLPQMSELRFKHYLMLLHYIVIDEGPNEENLADAVISNRQKLEHRSDRDVGTTAPNNRDLEIETLRYIENGDLPGMKSFIRRKISSGGELRKSADDFLRSAKNTLIKSSALACRAAIKGGVDYSVATGIADRYVFRAERLTDSRDVFALNSDMLLHYTELTSSFKKLNSRSPIVRDVYNYINANIYRKISLKDISESLNLSPAYVSRKFKEETSNALGEYITQLRLEKAKSLLLSSDMSISEIAYSLGFSTQNYFHKVFKDAYGKTPVEYKTSGSYDDI